MTNEVGKALFSKAGELGIPVGFMCMKVSFCLVNSVYIYYIKIKTVPLKGHFSGSQSSYFRNRGTVHRISVDGCVA